ncbi:peptidylprolyl isomerase [Aliikangiella sp. IMCC44653]
MNSFKALGKLIASLLIISGIVACTQEKDPALKEITAFIEQQSIDKNLPEWKTKLPKPPALTFDPNKSYFWDMQTNLGLLSIKFYHQVAPMHVSSSIYLTELGFYDGLKFHRVINNFMAQGGDPLGNGMGGPGYSYAGEFSEQAKHSKAGILSMANSGPNTDGSQFFITFRATPHLNGLHTVFGELVAGEEVLKKIEAQGSRSGRTQQDIVIEKASIRIK